MVIIKVEDAQGLDFATLFATSPEGERPGWLSVQITRYGMTPIEATEFYRQFGNALAIMRGDVKVAT